MSWANRSRTSLRETTARPRRGSTRRSRCSGRARRQALRGLAVTSSASGCALSIFSKFVRCSIGSPPMSSGALRNMSLSASFCCWLMVVSFASDAAMLFPLQPCVNPILGIWRVKSRTCRPESSSRRVPGLAFIRTRKAPLACHQQQKPCHHRPNASMVTSWGSGFDAVPARPR